MLRKHYVIWRLPNLKQQLRQYVISGPGSRPTSFAVSRVDTSKLFFYIRQGLDHSNPNLLMVCFIMFI